MNIFKRFKPWQMVGLASLVVVAVIAAVGASALSGGGGVEQASPIGDAGQQVAVEQQPVDREIPVNGHLVFSDRVELTFKTSGEVGEILVQEGERVEERQVLARLNSLTMTALEESRAQAQFDLDQAQEELARARKAEFTDAPLVQAQFEGEVAKAQKALTDAEERLRDFQRNQQQELTAAMKARADAERALDNAQRALSHYDRDQVQELATARNNVATAELALDAAANGLANFDEDYRESLANARLKVGQAEETFDMAEDNLADFFFSLRSLAADQEDGDNESVEEMNRLQVAVEEARTNLEQVRRELTRLEGNRLLLLQEKQTAVDTARADLKEARDDVARLDEETNQLLELRERQAAVEAAQANLAQAEIDLQEELEGPDQEDLAVRQKEVALAQERLRDLTNPDPSDVALQEAKVSRAQARMDDALEELKGATILAPFDGVVSLVNAETDDIVDDESRVIELIAPGSVAVEGLIDATNIRFVKEGSKARVTIASVPGQGFEGTVIQVAKEPRTERGVLSHPVSIQVEVPPGVEVPVSLSQVTSVVIYEG
jgi:multidrug efflux pump subunit AcrA (membrane-fusion protein)